MARSREGIFGKIEVNRQTVPPDDPREWGAKCDQCPLNGSTPVWGDGPLGAQLAFVGEAPGRDEVSLGLPFVGRSGQTWENWLSRLGLTRREVWVDNAVMCFPPGGDMKFFLQREKKLWKKAGKAWADPVECCRPRLMRALKVPSCKRCGKYMRGPNEFLCICKTPKWLAIYAKLAKLGERMPIVTVPMGNFAMQALLGFDGISAHAGYVEDMKRRREEAMGLVKKLWQLVGLRPKQREAPEADRDKGP